MITIADIQAARDQAEAATDIDDIFAATVREVSMRWTRAGQPDGAPRMEVAMMKRIVKARNDRVAYINRVEEWRTAWIKFLHQRDLTSSARLNVIDSFRRAKTR